MSALFVVLGFFVAVAVLGLILWSAGVTMQRGGHGFHPTPARDRIANVPMEPNARQVDVVGNANGTITLRVDGVRSDLWIGPPSEPLGERVLEAWPGLLGPSLAVYATRQAVGSSLSLSARRCLQALAAKGELRVRTGVLRFTVARLERRIREDVETIADVLAHEHAYQRLVANFAEEPEPALQIVMLDLIAGIGNPAWIEEAAWTALHAHTNPDLQAIARGLQVPAPRTPEEIARLGMLAPAAVARSSTAIGAVDELRLLARIGTNEAALAALPAIAELGSEEDIAWVTALGESAETRLARAVASTLRRLRERHPELQGRVTVVEAREEAGALSSAQEGELAISPTARPR